MSGWPLWLTIGCIAVVMGAVAWRVAEERRALTPADILATAPAHRVSQGPAVPARQYANATYEKESR